MYNCMAPASVEEAAGILGSMAWRVGGAGCSVFCVRVFRLGRLMNYELRPACPQNDVPLVILRSDHGRDNFALGV